MYILEKTDKLFGKTFFYIEQPSGEKAALFLHGKSYTSKDFLKLNSTIESLFNLGYRFYAVDLPGFGKSEKNDVNTTDFIRGFIDKFNLRNVVLVGASISGGFVLQYALYDSDNLKAIVSMAPARIKENIESFSKVTVPVLLMWGENDDKVNPSIGYELNEVIKDSKLYVFKNLGHPFYFENEGLFKSHLLEFLNKIGG